MNDTYSSTSVTTTQSNSSTNTSNRSFLNTSICDDYACTSDYQKRRSRSLVCVSHNHHYTRLKDEIDHLKCLLKEKDDIIIKLVDIREKLESEVRELSASLFEQAYKMVNTAKEETVQTGKLLQEAQNKVDVLEAEVKALKELVITSTPSTPNRHLHPQLNKSTSFNSNQALLLTVSTPKISHRRTSSSNDTKALQKLTIKDNDDDKNIYEIDPTYFKEMAEWLCEMNNNNLPFINRILTEDILPCINFSNKQLSNDLLNAIQLNCVCIEEITNTQLLEQTQICSLSLIPSICQFKIKLSELSTKWYFISKSCRNRIISICDFYNYLRYIKDGLVKSENRDIYWNIIDLRKRISLSRLGM